MKRYHKVTSRLWCDPRVSRLSDAGQLLFLFILTNPLQTSLGAFRQTREGLAAEKHWSMAKLNRELDQLIDAGLVECDDEGFYLGVPDFFADNLPESPNVVKAWRSALEFIPDSTMKARQLLRAAAAVRTHLPKFADAVDAVIGDARLQEGSRLAEGLREGSVEGLREGLSEALPDGAPEDRSNQDPNQDPKQEPEEEHKSQPSSVHSSRSDLRREAPAELVGEQEANFDAFWRAYPRKERKEAARSAWARLKPDSETAKQILAAIQKQRTSDQWLREGGRFIPHAAKWVEDKRWEDEPLHQPQMSPATIATYRAAQEFVRKMTLKKSLRSAGDAGRPAPPATRGALQLARDCSQRENSEDAPWADDDDKVTG